MAIIRFMFREMLLLSVFCPLDGVADDVPADTRWGPSVSSPAATAACRPVLTRCHQRNRL